MSDQTSTLKGMTGASLRKATIVGFQAMLLVVPLVFSPLIMEYGTPKMVIAQALSFSMAIVWLVSMVLDGEILIVDTTLYYTLLAFLTVNFVSLFQAYNVFQGLDTLFRYVCFFGIAVLVFHLVQTPGQMRRLAGTMTLTGGIVAAIGLLQHNNVFAFFAPQDSPVSTIGNVNFVAQYYDIVFPISLVMFALVRRAGARIGVGAACFLMACHLIVLGSRGGWLGVGVGVAILCGILAFRHFQMERRFVDTLVTAVVLIGLAWPVVTSMVSDIQVGNGRNVSDVIDDYWAWATHRISAGARIADDSTRQRVNLWEDTLRLIFDRPVLGVGAGNFEFNIPKYFSRESLEVKKRMEGDKGVDLMAFNAHNDYLQVAAETGFLGLAVFGVFLYQLLRALYDVLARFIRKDGDLLVVGLAAALGATLVHAFFDTNLEQPASAVHFWVVVGMIWSLKLNAEGREPLALLFTGARKIAVGMIAVCGVALMGVIVMGTRTLIGEYYYLKGRKAFDAKGYATAEMLWRRASAYSPTEFFRTYQSLGMALYNQQKWQAAIPPFRKSLAYFPNNARVHELLGQALLQTGQAQEAVPHFKAAAALNPLKSEFQVGLGEALGKASDFQAALAALQKALKLDPDNAKVYQLIGFDYKQQGNLDAAIVAYRKALQLAPDNTELQNSLAVAYSARGDYKAARDLFRALVAQAPDNVDYRFNLAVTQVLLEQYADAMANLRAVIAQQPTYMRAYVVMGKVLTEQGHLQAAQDVYREAQRLWPNDATLQEALQQLGKP